MPIIIKRGRQFKGADNLPKPLWDGDRNLGAYPREMAQKLAAQEITVRLTNVATGEELLLKTEDDWDRFLDAHLGDRRTSEALVEKFGVSVEGLVNIMDDAAESLDRGVLLDLAPTSELHKALGLASRRDDYALNLLKDQGIDLAGPVVGRAIGAGVNEIGPWILDAPMAADWQRDRQEQEGWGDFKNGRGANRIFRDNTGPAPFLKLTEPDWKDPEALAVMERFSMPLHLEQSPEPGPNGEKKFQDRNEMFREVYLTDVDGVLEKLRASLRVRVRFDKKDKPAGAPPDAPDEFEVRRVLAQAKEGREVDPATGASIVHKFEMRWGANMTEDAAMSAVLTGKHEGEILAMIQKLYKLAKDAGLLPPDGKLKLQAKSVVLQRRRRTHLQLDSIATVKARLEKAKAELVAAGAAPDPALVRFVAALDTQLAKMNEMNVLLQKHGGRLSSGECLIVSADRYNVYDPGSRSSMPNDIDDAQGRVGVGPLHVEAEWDTAGSEPFEKALEKIEEQLKANPANADELKADAAKLEEFRAVFRDNVKTAKDLLCERLKAAGLDEEPEKRSKEEWSDVIMANRANVPFYWFG